MRLVFTLALALVLARAGPAFAQRRFLIVAPPATVVATPYAAQYYTWSIAPLVYQQPAAAVAQSDPSAALARLQREMTLLSATVSTHTEILNAHDAALRRLLPAPK